jgi:hypothetical protein
VQVFISGAGSFGSSGTTDVKPQDTTVYTLTASYVDGTALTASTMVTVEQPPYLLYGLIALLAVAAAVIVALLVRRPSAAPAAQSAGTRPAAATAAAITSTALASPSTAPVIEAMAAKLAMPDGSEVLLAGNARSLGRKDFEKFLSPDEVSYLSRQHINIWFEDSKYYIEDRSSTNGTRVNGIDIKDTGRHVLEDSDAIDLAGKLNITFKL